MGLRISRTVGAAFFLVIVTAVLTSSTPRPADEADRVRAFTRGIEFDYLSWMLNAAQIKIQQSSAGIPGYLSYESAKVAVSDYFQVTQQIIRAENALNAIYADPAIADKAAASQHIREQLQQLYQRQNEVAPIAEAVLQAQVSQVAADMGLTFLGQPVPSVLFHSTSVPDALIVSPRSRIEQSANISIEPGLPVDQQDDLENRVENGLDVSALVVPIGGVGVYPTMIMRTTDLNWLTSTIAHEWTHNFLELRPLGLLYDYTPELRTMNETTADIVGGEVGHAVMQRFYPELAQSGAPDLSVIAFPGYHIDPTFPTNPVFDFRAEMHATRVIVDALLASGKISEAEQYMEQRRQVFVENGFYIRRLNQAYFAFYGAYAELPGGAAGEDPVGPAVRSLRSESPSLAAFVNRISWMTSFNELERAVGQ